MSVPQKIGRYEIVGHECRYDLNDVYAGYDPQENRKVSIRAWKNTILEDCINNLPDGAAVNLKSAILRQAGAAGRLHHDNIGKIHDAGEDTEQGYTYVVCEWLDCRDIWIYSKQEALLPPTTVLAIIFKVAMALDHAHRRNVVHFYVNPRTIFFDSEKKAVKIVGFEDAPMVERVQSRFLIGAPFASESYKFVQGDLMYMAPELVTDEPVDSRADLFSLGLVFLSLLIGRLPAIDRLDELIGELPTALKGGTRKRRLFRSNAPPDAAAIIRRALERHAKDRYRTGAEMAQDILVLAESGRKKFG